VVFNIIIYFILGWSCIIGLVAGLVLTFFIPRMADAEKLRSEEDKKLVGYLNNPWLPKRLLTPAGQKVWTARNYALAIGLIATVLCLLLGPPPQ
jgi:hypothetical protein